MLSLSNFVFNGFKLGSIGWVLPHKTQRQPVPADPIPVAPVEQALAERARSIVASAPACHEPPGRRRSPLPRQPTMENLAEGLSGAGGDGRDSSVASFLAGKDGLDEPGSRRGVIPQVSSSSLSCCQHPESGNPLQGSGVSSCRDQAIRCQYFESCSASHARPASILKFLIEACTRAFVFFISLNPALLVI
jgi:hypothetical protein